MMTTRVRRRRPRVPPRKGRQPLPQFGAGSHSAFEDDMKLRALNSVLRLMGEKQVGGRLTPRRMKAVMRATDPRRLGIFPQQRGRGLWSTLASKVAGKVAAKAAGKMAKTAAKRAAKQMAAKMTKQVAKQVAKKVAKKAAMGAVAGAAGWGATKALNKIG